MDKIYVYGASGHGLVIADIALSCGYKEVIFIDDSKLEYQKFEDIKKDSKTSIIIGIGDNKTRAKLQQKVKEKGFNIPTLIHQSAIISPTVTIGEGVVIMPNVVVNAMANIGDGSILNTGCIVEHECKIGSFVHVSPNTALAGNVSVGNFTHIGIGSSIKQSIKIGEDSILGAGSVVVADIKNKVIAHGNPCKTIKDNI
ncbi:UDP-N-acetylbacillosamine N-acetyltransferase [Sulfurovum sp. enrichment culture clone C5]|uniref:UDP-N-acetylbacillosamine N-acetyltransferase n=1 Tax=Sulfurovum sp. enrichment culture clone C5 TaxID=497650 RepID=A0A0S4XQK0_9BACT|nr:UDP-N-acetylbacillosamine N-acetyltransferase [Sulfurovum sp. enrichment culture clone C5]